MKKLILLSSLLVSTICIGQTTDPFVKKLEDNSYEKLFNSEFTKLASGQSIGNFGQYASVATTNDVFKASVFITKKRSFSKITLSGGTKDGIGSLFSNDKFNSSVGLGYDYFLLVGQPEFQTDDNQIRYLSRERELNILAYNLLTKNLKQGTDTLDTLKTSLNDIEKKLKDPYLTVTNKGDLTIKKNDLEKKIKAQEGLNTDKRIAIDKNQTAGLKIEAKADKSSLFIKKVAFLSMGGSTEFNDVLLFDRKKELAEQLFTKDYQKSSLRINYNLIKQKETKTGSFKAHSLELFTIGLAGNLGSNIGQLKKLTIRDSDSIGSTRSTYVDRVGFEGDFDDELLSANLTVEYIKLFNNINSIGLHLKGNYEIMEDVKPITTLQIGAIFPFSNNKDKSIVNIEIFYKNSDLFTSSPITSALREPIIGFQTTFPVKF